MVNEVLSDWMPSHGESEVSSLRCVQCGEVVDSVILTNRRIQHEKRRDDRRLLAVANVPIQTRTYGKFCYVTYAVRRGFGCAGFLIALFFVGGCAADRTRIVEQGSDLSHASIVSQEIARDSVIAYRRQAIALHELARMLTMEGEWHRRQAGSDSQEATRRLSEARKVLAAAEQADDLARQYQRQMPHGRVQ
jgi:hypothetical protein